MINHGVRFKKEGEKLVGEFSVEGMTDEEVKYVESELKRSYSLISGLIYAQKVQHSDEDED